MAKENITGSILSQNSRNNIFRSASVEAPSVANNIVLFQNQQRQIDLDSSAALAEQQRSFVSFNSSIQDLRNDIGKLGSGLNGISLLLQQDAASDRSRILEEQEKERRYTEQKIRIGKENQLEQKIQNAVAEPVEKLTPKVQNIFSGVGEALKILFGTWLSLEAVKLITAYENKNTDILYAIKNNVLKSIGIAVGGLIAIRTGFNLVKNTLGSIISSLTKLFTPKPIMGGGVANAIGSAAPILGKFVTFLSGYLNLQNKEYVDSFLAALSLAAKAPGPIGAIAKVAGIAFTADEIAEAFGKNIFGDERDKIVDEIAKSVSGQSQSQGNSSGQQSTAPAPVTEAMPSVPSTGTNSQSPNVSPQQTAMGAPVKPDTTAQSSLTPERISQFEMAWKYRNNPLARGRIEAAWEKLTPEEKRQAKEWAKTKGYNWSEMNLKDDAPTSTQPTTPAPASTQPETQSTQTPPLPGPPPPELENIQPPKSEKDDASQASNVEGTAPASTTSLMPSSQSTPPASQSSSTVSSNPPPYVPPPPSNTPSISPQQISPLTKGPQQVGQLPEPSPKITMIAPVPGSSQQPTTPPVTNGPLTDVPLINSANPDNFYVLYSQLNYNVVT